MVLVTRSVVIESPSGSLSLDNTEVAPPLIVVTVPPSNTVMASCTEIGGLFEEVKEPVYIPLPKEAATTRLFIASTPLKSIS